MPETVAAVVERALALAEEKFIVAGGPGGQNVNKVATAVQLRLDVFVLRLEPAAFHRLQELTGSKLTKAGTLVLTASEYRTQAENREAARVRLVALIEGALTPPKPRRKSRLNRVGKEARLQGKKVRGTVKANRGKVEW